MKRKLSLMLALLMVLTLIPVTPSFAATSNRVDRQLSVGSDEEIKAPGAPTLSIKNDKSDFTSGDVFELKLGADAEWQYSETATNIIEKGGSRVVATVVKRTGDILQVTVQNPQKDDEIRIPLLVKFDGAEAGVQEVTVLPLNSGATGGKYAYATVGANDINFRVESKKSISRGQGDNEVNLIFEEVVKNGFGSKTFSIKLPKYFTWRETSVSSNIATIARDSRDSRILNVTFNNTNQNVIERLYLKANIDIDRGASYGDVNVTLNGAGAGSISPDNLVVAEYVGYNVDIKAEKVLDVVAGKDENNKYVSVITVEEKVANALVDGRYLEVSFVDKDGKKAPASLQNIGGEALRFENTKNRIRSTVDWSDATDRTPRTQSNNPTATGRRVCQEWDLLPVNGSNDKDKFKMKVAFVVAADYEGELFLKFDGAGVDKQMVKIADVKPAISLEVSSLTQVKVGLQKQKASDITIKETVAGALQDYVEGGAREASYTLKSSEPDWFIFRGVKAERTAGDIILEDYDLLDNGRSGVVLEISRKSTEASTIKLTDMYVTLDRTVPYGEVKLNANFGVVNNRHQLTDMTVSKDYFTTVTPVSDDKRVVTVFKLDDKNFTRKSGNSVDSMAMDVAPYAKAGSTMLPIRYVGEALGAQVEWNGATRQVTIAKGAVMVTIAVDSDTMYVNGSPIKMSQKPDALNGRTFLPLKSIAQAFGLQTDVSIFYNASNKTVTILPQDAKAEEIEAAKNGTILEVK